MPSTFHLQPFLGMLKSPVYQLPSAHQCLPNLYLLLNLTRHISHLLLGIFSWLFCIQCLFNISEKEFFILDVKPAPFPVFLVSTFDVTLSIQLSMVEVYSFQTPLSILALTSNWSLISISFISQISIQGVNIKFNLTASSLISFLLILYVNIRVILKVFGLLANLNFQSPTIQYRIKFKILSRTHRCFRIWPLITFRSSCPLMWPLGVWATLNRPNPIAPCSPFLYTLELRMSLNIFLFRTIYCFLIGFNFSKSC